MGKSPWARSPRKQRTQANEGVRGQARQNRRKEQKKKHTDEKKRTLQDKQVIWEFSTKKRKGKVVRC